MTKELPLTVYSPESGLSNPCQLLKELIRDMFSPQTHELAIALLKRDIKGQYRMSFLGLLWMFVPVIVNTFVWVFLNKQNVLNVGTTSIPYPVYVFAGTLMWNSFTQGLTAPIGAVNKERGMLTKLQFPREALLVTGLAKLLFDTIVQLAVFLPVFLWYHMPLTSWLLLIPVVVIATPFCGYAIGVMLTPAALLFSDLVYMIPFVVRFWFFLTPIIYPVPHNGLIGWIARLNPATPLIVTARDVLSGQPPTMLPQYFITVGACMLLCFAGLIIYRLAMPIVIERMSA
ncbi:MAG: ABC transporter permease [Spartobacteria bacterium]|nr:ABC transporter permease [Spartobacteria bacterium]